MYNERMEIIDIAKGIGIFLVVAGHCLFQYAGIIYLFHMALFFFLSGYCYNEKYNESFQMIYILLKKRIKSLYMPFIKYGLIFVMFHNFFFKIHFYISPNVWQYNKVEYFISIREWIIAILGIISFSRIEQLLAPFWFLPILFMTTIIFAVLSYLSNNEINRLVSIFLLFLFFCLYDIYWGLDNNKLFRALAVSSLSLIPFYMGLVTKKFLSLDKINNKNLLFMAVLILVLNSFYGKINIAGFEFKSLGFFLLSSIVGIYIIMYISNVILKAHKIKIIILFLGKNTIAIMALHYTAFKIISYIIIFIYDLPISYLAYPTLLENSEWKYMYLIVGLLLPSIFILIIKKIKERILV